ncbi:mitochondrial fission ELM1 family protein [Pelagibacteraceae bacterium]|nr:mitochondrial fission ELM1 family protein [Pelagibacteraceae bacterium]
MSKLKALLLTQGMHGMISQVEGLAKALNLDYKHQTIKLKKLWNYIPPKFTPITENILSENFICNAEVIISCGRKSVIPSIALKKKFGKNIINIHIQDPKVKLSNFDFIVAPEHDGLSGKNVLTSKGAIHYLTNKELDGNENYLKSKINNQKKIVTFIIGGPTKYYDYNNTTIDNIFLKIKQNFLEKNYQLIAVPSMRTPQYIIDKAKNYFNEDQVIIPVVDKKAYLCSLKKADHIIVTCDSTSMISEAAITGKPIYVAQMPTIKNNKRFKSFFNLFVSLNIIKELGSSVESWTYNKLNETSKIADQIREKIKLHDFS